MSLCVKINWKWVDLLVQVPGWVLLTDPCVKKFWNGKNQLPCIIRTDNYFIIVIIYVTGTHCTMNINPCDLVSSQSLLFVHHTMILGGALFHANTCIWVV